MSTVLRFIRDRLRLVFLPCVSAGLFGCVSTGGLSGQVVDSVRQDTFFYSDGERVRVIIVPDSFAVVLRDGATVGQLRRAAERLALRVVREFPGRIFLLSGADSLTFRGSVAFARDLRRGAADLVVNAGVMVRPAGAVSPLFLTDEVLVQFRQEAAASQIALVLARLSLDNIPTPYLAPNQLVVRVGRAPGADALTTANRLHEEPLVEYAQPNFIRPVVSRSGPARPLPNDPLFGNQWHLNNTGQGGGTVDADIDAPEAWDLTLGNASVVIGVLDDGFDMAHEDLAPNLWVNSGETAGNGVDDDGNGLVDDVNGWDFTGNDNNPAADVGDDHGTGVAGAAAARGNNAIGVSGSCPTCRLMLLRNGATVAAQAQAFNYAQQNGAAVISNSWGYALVAGTGPVQTAINQAATNGRGGLGSVVLFAMNNGNVNDCIGTPDISSLANVIAVSASSNQDRKVAEAAWGNCMDVLGPTHRGYGPNPLGSPAGSGVAYTGTLNVATTDRSGNLGYNNTSPQNNTNGWDPTFCPAESTNLAYSFCHGGTSAATPITAGIAGLVLSANAGLTRLAVQRLLQDAADRIEDSNGRYADNTGFSTPASGVARNGFGRVNAFEAVRIVAPATSGGRGGVDVFLRDNRLDWGNTEQPSNTLFEPTRSFIGHWESMDIKVDAPPYQTVPTAATFEAFTDETPSARSGNINRVYVRVRNRGPSASAPVTVRFFWAQFGTALPSLVSDFWTNFPNNTTDPSNRWNPLSCSTGSSNCTISSIAYSGSSVAGTAADAAQIVQFDFPAPPIDPSLPNHFCLLAIVDAAPDRPLPLTRPARPNDFVVDWLTPNDNNVTHRNYLNLSTTRSSSFTERFFVRNPTRQPVRVVLRAEVPRGWEIAISGVPAGQPFTLTPGEERLVTAQVATPGRGAEGEVRFVQERIDVTPNQVMGGLTYGFRALTSSGGLRRALSLHGGAALPFGSLDASTDPGPTLNLDLLHPFTPQVGVDLRLGYSLFTGAARAPDVDTWDLAVNLKVIPMLGTPWVFVNGGLGMYHVDSADWESGFNMGAGLGQPLGSSLVLEATFNYHRTFTASPDVRFGKVQLGLLWSF